MNLLGLQLYLTRDIYEIGERYPDQKFELNRMSVIAFEETKC
jgi:hypothetical protein